MENKVCTQCNIEKNIEDLYNKSTEYKTCNSNRSLKGYYEKKDKISNQKNISYEKNREQCLKKQNNRHRN